MGIIFPEPQRPQSKIKIVQDMLEGIEAQLPIGTLVYVNSEKAMFISNGRWQLSPLSERKVCERHRKYIKCEYCESELEDKFVNCPNCGAPLKRSGKHD